MVRYKEKFPSPFIVRLYFTPSSISLWPCLTLSSTKGMGNGELWSVHNSFSLSILPHTPCSCFSHSCSFPWAVAPARSLLHWGVSTELQFSICHSVGSFTGCRGDFCFTVLLRGLQVDGLLPLQPLHGLQEYLSSGAWNTSFPPSLLALVSVRWFLTLLFYSHSVLSQTLPWSILPFLKYVFLKASPAPLLELPGVSSMGQPLAFPHRDQHCSSPLCYQLLVTCAQYKSDTTFLKNRK